MSTLTEREKIIIQERAAYTPEPETPTITLIPSMLAALRPAFEAMVKKGGAETRQIGARVLAAHNVILSGSHKYDVVPVPLTLGVQRYVGAQLANLNAAEVVQNPQSPVARLARTIASKLQPAA
jgi:hypothetical protein